MNTIVLIVAPYAHASWLVFLFKKSMHFEIYFCMQGDRTYEMLINLNNMVFSFVLIK
jgi:hypothetical protein